MHEKDESIRDLLRRLDLGSRGWEVVDLWPDDPMAIGVRGKADPYRVAYVLTWGTPPGRYFYEFDRFLEGEEDEFVVVESGEDVDFDTLQERMLRFLGSGSR